MGNEIYFDNSATTSMHDFILDEMYDLGKQLYGNPSSLHKKGLEAEEVLKKARQTISETLYCDENEVIFTSGGTESNNLAIRGFLKRNKRSGKQIISTKIEHPSINELLEDLKKEGYSIDYIDVDKNGNVIIEDLKEKISEDTALATFAYVNSEIGTILNILEIKKVLKAIDKKIALHIDAVQAYGKIKIDPKKLGISMMSISSHKIHGPKGVGGLFIDKGIKIEPIIYGGGQENGIRPGTENIVSIYGFSLASQYMFENLGRFRNNIAGVKEYFVKKLKEEFDSANINSPKNSLDNILSVGFEGVPAEVLLHFLEDKGVYVSTGSACSSRKKRRSNVLVGIGLKNSIIDGTVRFSFSKYNNIEQAKYTIDLLKEIIPKLTFK